METKSIYKIKLMMKHTIQPKFQPSILKTHYLKQMLKLTLQWLKKSKWLILKILNMLEKFLFQKELMNLTLFLIPEVQTFGLTQNCAMILDAKIINNMITLYPINTKIRNYLWTFNLELDHSEDKFHQITYIWEESKLKTRTLLKFPEKLEASLFNLNSMES